MSSTTTTQSIEHEIVKYSRAYPTCGEARARWQHFSNPIIRLSLDTKRSNLGKLESVRLRINWCINESSQSESETVRFEDLELLAYASLRPPNHLTQPPLKAMYSGCVVALRYLHPISAAKDASSSSDFRCIQVAFASPMAVKQIIDVLQIVCPCTSKTAKNLGGSDSPRSQTQTSLMPPPSSQGRVKHIREDSAPYDSRSGSPSRARRPMESMITNSQMDHRESPVGCSYEDPRATNSSHPTPVSPSPSYLPRISSAALNRTIRSSPPPPTPVIRSVSRASFTSQQDDFTWMPQNQPSYTPLLSSQPSPSPLRHLSPSPVPTMHGSSRVTSAPVPQIHQSLCDTALISEPRPLQDLSPSELEKLVSAVIMDDSFTDIMTTLDSLWRIKGLIR